MLTNGVETLRFRFIICCQWSEATKNNGFEYLTEHVVYERLLIIFQFILSPFTFDTVHARSVEYDRLG